MLEEYKYIYATFYLWGKGFDPQEVTESLELLPTRSHKIGDWRNESKLDRWKHSYWSLSSKEEVKSSNLATHIEWIINKIEQSKSRLLDILNRDHIKAEISCFWILPSDHEYLNISSELLKKIAELNLNMEIDIYSNGEEDVNVKSEKKE